MALHLGILGMSVLPGQQTLPHRNPFDRIVEIDTAPRPHRPAGDYPPAPPHGAPLGAPNMEWVTATLARMTLAQKVGQLIITQKHAEGDALVRDLHVGGFTFLGNNQQAATIVAAVNRLQAVADVPLWFAIDAEAGVGARVNEATLFPMQMAFGAAGDPALAEECGRITARECRALGLHAAHGPVVDVNTAAANPIVSTRSYGADPELVTTMARAFLRGAAGEGILCTLKHYPGHGATLGDSHHEMPAVHATREELESIHLAPFRALAASGDADLVMTAHIWYSAIHPNEDVPATLSPVFNRHYLREEIGFKGVLLTDAFNMKGIVAAVAEEGERAVRSIEAGIDVIVVPDDVARVHAALMEAWESGRLSPTALDDAVRRVLIAKSRAGLPARRFVDPTEWTRVLDHPAHRAVVRRVAQRAFTRLHPTAPPTGAPIPTAARVAVVTLAGSHLIFYRFGAEVFRETFAAAHPASTFVTAPRVLDEESARGVLDATAGADHVVVLGFDWFGIASAEHAALVRALIDRGRPVHYVSFGAPYHAADAAGAATIHCGYASIPAVQEVAAQVLLGLAAAPGKVPVPVTIPAP